ncbi:MAG: isoprenylcysteine carboxylmethyltransferase family protein [Syntrophobacteraceae bacterium]|jgi:protein-S-isoprenylcysteine O-methyltransferase Ste14
MEIRAKVILWQAITFPVMALALFIPAGTGAWLAGWVYLLVFAVFSVAMTRWLLSHNPGLLEERIGFKPDQKTWDKLFVVAVNIVFLAWLVLMPLDSVRFGWSRMPVGTQMAGGIVLLYSFYVFYLTFRENPFLSSAVRIQKDRRQTVVSTGPYRYVRHPMYAGAFLHFLGTALLLGSWLGVFFVPIFVVMITIRAIFEERMLEEQLEGYKTYMAQVPFRFIPHLW